MSARKVKAGRCGVCGCPVTIDGEEPPGQPSPDHDVFWSSGHEWRWDVTAKCWVLKSVRCFEHADRHDPRKAYMQPGATYWGPV